MSAITSTPVNSETRISHAVLPALLPFIGILARRDDPAVRQQRLLGADRHPRGDLLGAGLRPEPDRRLRRPSRDRLCRTADARRLHHQRAGRRQCNACRAGIRRAADRRLRRCGVRRHRRTSSVKAAHLLFRDVDARLCHHRHPDRAGMAERHRRRHRHRRAGISRAVQHRVGLLLSLRRLCRRLHLDERQYRPQPVRPRADRGPRRRSRGRSHRHFQAAAC